MAYVKENKRQMRAKLQALYRPYPVAMTKKGEPSLPEMASRLHQACLANKNLDEYSDKYRQQLLKMANPRTLYPNGDNFLGHKKFMSAFIRSGYTVREEDGKWVKSCK